MDELLKAHAFGARTLAEPGGSNPSSSAWLIPLPVELVTFHLKLCGYSASSISSTVTVNLSFTWLMVSPDFLQVAIPRR